MKKLAVQKMVSNTRVSGRDIPAATETVATGNIRNAIVRTDIIGVKMPARVVQSHLNILVQALINSNLQVVVVENMINVTVRKGMNGKMNAARKKKL